MSFFKYVIDTLKSSYKLSKMFLKDNKRLLLIDLFLGLSTECKKIIAIVLPTIVIQAVILKKSINIIFVYILIMSISTALLGTVIDSIRRNISNHSIRATNCLYYVLNGKSARLDLKDCEDDEIINEYYKAFDNIYQFSDVHYHIFCTLISKTLSFFVMSYVIVSINWLLYVLIISIQICSMFIRAKQDKTDHLFEKQKSESSKRLTYLKELMYSFNAGREMRIYNGEELISNKFLSESRRVHTIDIQMKKKDFLYQCICQLLWLVQLSLIYVFSINQYANGKIVLGSFVMYINAATLISSSVSDITNAISFLYKSSIAFKDFENYLSIKESIRENGTINTVIIEKEPLIEFRNVSFRYPNAADYSLKNISFKINKGDIVSIIGNNGAGKSTLIKLLLRLYDPTEGSIYYNGINIKEYDFDYYQGLFAPVFQDYVMHAYTLRENLIFNHNECEQRIDQALLDTGMYEKVQQIGLDRNYSRRFFNDGIEFSGGEEQRFAIARALCKYSNVLLLDEPTAAIDPLSESKLFKEIFNAVKDQTVLFISHRMPSTRFSNCILVLDKSKLVETGTHDELIEKKGLYSKMYSLQASYYQ